jgi:hypothetical protein
MVKVGGGYGKQPLVKRIGRINGLLRRHPGRALPSAPRRRPRLAHTSSRALSAERQPRRSAPEPDVERPSAAWTCSSGGERGGPSGEPLRRRPREGRLGNAGGVDSNGSSNAQRCETPLRCAHVAYETTRDVVGLGNPIERFLARTGRYNGRWDGGKLEMTQDARDDRLLGNGGNNAERATSAKGTGAHIQIKHAS